MRFMLPRRTLILSVLATLVVACSGAPKDDGKTVRIIAGGPTVQGAYVPGGLTGVVQSEKWLEQQLAQKGYRLEFVEMPHAIGGPMINEGFANKSLEFALYGDLPAVIGAGGGVPIRLVASLQGVTNTYVLVAPRSPARSIADLKGTRVALHRGRPWEPAFARAVDAAGLKISDFKVLNVNPSAGAAALAAGKVDAFVGPIADADRLLRQKAGRILWSTKAAPPAWAARTDVFARKDYVADHPDVAELVAAAYYKAGAWAALPANREAYIKSLSAETAETAIRADLEGSGAWAARFTPTPAATLRDHYAYVIDYSAANGLIGEKPPLDDLTDTGLTAAALDKARAAGAPPTALAATQ
jgi:sulfonate transport system substrate-binding protein